MQNTLLSYKGKSRMLCIVTYKLLSCVYPARLCVCVSFLQKGEQQIDDQDEDKEYNTRCDQCFPVKIGRISHIDYDIGGHSTNTVEDRSRTRGWLPATMITAMVSPIARPTPRITAAIMPDFAAGTTVINTLLS